VLWSGESEDPVVCVVLVRVEDNFRLKFVLYFAQISVAWREDDLEVGLSRHAFCCCGLVAQNSDAMGLRQVLKRPVPLPYLVHIQRLAWEVEEDIDFLTRLRSEFRVPAQSCAVSYDIGRIAQLLSNSAD